MSCAKVRLGLESEGRNDGLLWRGVSDDDARFANARNQHR